MYLAVDIGATKTLLGVFNGDGGLVETIKFLTPQEYSVFLSEIAKNVANLSTKKWTLGAIGVAGLVNREEGIVYVLGNLPWRDKHVRDDISRIVGGLKIKIENDAKLAGLAEARLLLPTYTRVLYLTISTGIGGAIIENGQIAKTLQDTEMGSMPLIFEGKLQRWEDFAGGRGVVNKFSKKAYEITEPEAWEEIGSRVAYGLGAACAILQPEVIVFGGGVGQFVNKFKVTIEEYMNKKLHPIIRRPKALLEAKHKEDGVIYGCCELIRATSA